MKKKRIIFESLYRTSCFSQSFLLPYVYGILLRLVNYLMVFTYVICDVANFNLSKDKQPVAADKLKHTKKPAAIIFSARHVLRRLRLRSIDASGGMPAGIAGPNMFACVRAMLARGVARTGSNVYIFKLASEV